MSSRNPNSGPQALTVSTLHTESTPQLIFGTYLCIDAFSFLKDREKIKVALSIVTISVVYDLPG